MNPEHREIKVLISVMAPTRAVEFVQAFKLPEIEEKSIIECDVNDKSYAQAAPELGLSPESLKRCRKRAFAKMADAMRHQDEKSKEESAQNKEEPEHPEPKEEEPVE